MSWPTQANSLCRTLVCTEQTGWQPHLVDGFGVKDARVRLGSFDRTAECSSVSVYLPGDHPRKRFVGKQVLCVRAEYASGGYSLVNVEDQQGLPDGLLVLCQIFQRPRFDHVTWEHSVTDDTVQARLMASAVCGCEEQIRCNWTDVLVGLLPGDRFLFRFGVWKDAVKAVEEPGDWSEWELVFDASSRTPILRNLQTAPGIDP